MTKTAKTVVFVLLLSLTTWAVVVTLMLKNEIELNRFNNSSDVSTLEERKVSFNEIQTNVGSSYVSLELSMLTSNQKTAEELAKREFQVRNYILKYLSGSSKTDLENKDFMSASLDSLKTFTNANLSSGEVLEVYITKKLIH